MLSDEQQRTETPNPFASPRERGSHGRFARHGIALIMLGLLAWGAYHAVGAYLLNRDVRRPLVVLACVGAFLGFWLLMLASQRGRKNAASRSRHDR